MASIKCKLWEFMLTDIFQVNFTQAAMPPWCNKSVIFTDCDVNLIIVCLQQSH